MSSKTFNNTKINVEFDEDYQSRTNINSGENISSLFAKIRRFILDLKAVCFSGSYNDLSDVPDVVTKEYVDPIKSQAAINRTTLGTQCKNLLNETEYLSSITSISKGTMSISGNSITLTATANDCYTSPFANYDKGYKIPVTPNTSYILSWESNNNNSGNVFAFRNGSTSDGIGADNKHEGFKYLKFTTNSDTTFITIRFGVTTSGDSITYSNIMLRYADITDSSYEPYQPSVQEQVPYSISLPSKSTSESYSYNGVPTMICLTPSESVSSGGGLYLINSVGTAVYLIDKTGIVINTDTTNKTFTITNNTASTYDVYISCAYKKG